jgi:hypothetical protein
MNWKGWGRKRAWDSLKYFPDMSEGTEKSHEKTVKLAGLQAGASRSSNMSTAPLRLDAAVSTEQTKQCNYIGRWLRLGIITQFRSSRRKL